MPSLVFLKGPRGSERVPVVTQPFTIGRDPECDLIIDDETLSGVHAELRCERRIWSIRDNHSVNGTTHNGSPTSLAIVRSGDRIGLGDVLFRFEREPLMNAPDVRHAKDQTRLVEIRDSSMIVEDGRETDAYDYIEQHREDLQHEMVPYLIGDTPLVDLLLVCVLCGGHAILSGPTGIGRVRTARAFGNMLGLSMHEIHGVEELHQDASGLVLARGLNDMSHGSRTHLFSAMRRTRDARHDPLLILGIRDAGDSLKMSTAERNLFLMDIALGYPTTEQEQNMIARLTEEDMIPCIIPTDSLAQLQKVLDGIPIPSELLAAVVSALRRTRPGHPDAPEVVRNCLITGAGPSAGRYLLEAARAHAFIHGRELVLRTDVRAVLEPVIGHRLQFRDEYLSPDPVFEHIRALLEPSDI